MPVVEPPPVPAELPTDGQEPPVGAVSADARVREALKRHFGFDDFRPLQEEIVGSVLAGRDTFALLPTGGGKSLCFQLPAVLRPGLTLVISPLIALMKDQVDGLTANGVPATFLNSSLDVDEARARMRGLGEGKYRLLYVAPERLPTMGFVDALRNWNVSLIAIDEAHCISEWGHDFRPDYRKIVELREELPEVPMLALTATASERVQDDVVQQLRLRRPERYVASFNRPNLTYRVLPKQRPAQQVIERVQAHAGESGIVYCHSRRQTEAMAEALRGVGISALPYHAGLTHEERSEHQERFIRDDVQVVCATVAFGMGIDKSNVRFVIHHDLPKNIEGYYQETGRAGRDGLPSECVLLYGPGDVVKFSQFIDEKPDPVEQEVARRQLQQMVHYADSAQCRRKDLLAYFGEDYAGGNCSACDNCIDPRTSFDGTVAAQKFLSCVYRIRRQSGFAVGMNHVVEVLTGAKTEKIRRWHHDELTTYGVGTEFARPEWAAIGRELVRLGLLVQTTSQMSVLELTESGRSVLVDRTSVTLTVPRVAKAKPARRSSAAADIECDERIFEHLRALRKQLADERDVPAYHVFSDVTLRQMARDLPADRDAMSQVSGVGAKKLDEFGDTFLAAVAEAQADLA